MRSAAVGWWAFSNTFTDSLSRIAKEIGMVDGLSPEILTMAGGATMGHLFKLMSKAQEAKAAQQKLMLERMRGEQEVADANRKSANASADAAAARVGVDKWSPWARRVFVLVILYFGYLLLTAAGSGFDVVVPVEKQVGFNFLGIVDTTKTVTEFVRLPNAVVAFEWIKISILAAGSFYLGKS